MSAARDAYTTRLSHHRAEVDRLDGVDRRMAAARLLDAGLIVLVAWWAFGAGWLSGWWIIVPIAAFGALVVVHNRALQQRTAATRAIAFYERGLARLDERWSGTGASGDRFIDETHLYARDLDLFGSGSLFELLSIARTAIGEQTLAGWLLAPATPPVIASRQEAIAELRDRTMLREELAVIGETSGVNLDADRLERWGAATHRLTSTSARLSAALLAAGVVVTAIGWWQLGWGFWPLVIVLAIEAIFARAWQATVQRILAELHDAAGELEAVARMLARLEREPFTTPHLVSLQAALRTAGEPPSRAIARLGRLATLLDSKDNEIFRPIAAALIWDTQVAFAVEAWRAHHGPAIGIWLRTLGEVEALLSLAGYSFEHPDDPLPTIVEHGPRFEGEGLGHPLLPDAQTTRNDVRLGNEGPRAMLVSGSNMSGKSTLLRTVGINTVLALAGAPVRARALTVSPLAIGATLRIEDSLQAGRSRFFAEISRLREIVDRARGPLPLLFLLDEIFHGTNSHDRRVGAEAVIGTLVAQQAIGLVTTHDLALTDFTARADGTVVNMHFEDQFSEGTITFDYRLRSGVVQKSNALALMRAVGLEV
jgi:hypothetical protein